MKKINNIIIDKFYFFDFYLEILNEYLEYKSLFNELDNILSVDLITHMLNIKHGLIQGFKYTQSI